MKHSYSLAWAAVLIAAASLNLIAQGWEPYPQGGFIPYDLGVHPDGTVAYAAGREPIPGQSFLPSKVRRGDAGGTMWQDVSLPIGCDYADKVAVAPDGTVYLAGSEGRGTLAAGRVWASADGGTSWTTIALFPPGGQGPRDIQVNAVGNVFITTSKIISTSRSSTRRLVTYKGSPDVNAPAGFSWIVVDDYLPSGQQSCIPNTLTLRPGGSEVWIGGYVTDGRTYSPLMRRSIDGGVTWITVSAWPVPSGYDFSSGSWKVTAAADINGRAYVSANYAKKVGKSFESHCLTFRSINSGASWTLTDNVIAPTSAPNGAAADVFGGILISGGGMTRGSVDGGITWVNVPVAGGTHVSSDLVGNLFVGGATSEGVIYKLPAP